MDANLWMQTQLILCSSFPDAAYLVDLPLPGRAMPSVLHIPRSGEGSWYVPTPGMINVSSITPIQWTGRAFAFQTSLRVGAGPAPFIVKGEELEDGSIRGSLEPIDNGRIPFSEFTGRRK